MPFDAPHTPAKPIHLQGNPLAHLNAPKPYVADGDAVIGSSLNGRVRLTVAQCEDRLALYREAGCAEIAEELLGAMKAAGMVRDVAA